MHTTTNSSNGRWVGDVFYPIQFAGLCSILSVTLQQLGLSDKEANKINTKFTFTAYKEFADEDIWNSLFLDPNPNIKIDQKLDFNIYITSHDYLTMLKNQIDEFIPWIEKYFTPSNQVMKAVNSFIDKYNIDLENTVAVHYRGTDKDKICIKDTSSTSYVASQILEIVNQNPSMRVLVQSDCKNINEYFLNICEQYNPFYIKELPQSADGRAVHRIQSHYNFGVQYGINYLASLILISKCKHVITHYGNGGFWTCLFRGNIDNVLVL